MRRLAERWLRSASSPLSGSDRFQASAQSAAYDRDKVCLYWATPAAATGVEALNVPG